MYWKYLNLNLGRSYNFRVVCEKYENFLIAINEVLLVLLQLIVRQRSFQFFELLVFEKIL
jgi:hypothetical protein